MRFSSRSHLFVYVFLSFSLLGCGQSQQDASDAPSAAEPETVGALDPVPLGSAGPEPVVPVDSEPVVTVDPRAGCAA